jgi:hypothetical protein
LGFLGYRYLKRLFFAPLGPSILTGAAAEQRYIRRLPPDFSPWTTPHNGNIVIESIKPPTDNLYKFVAVTGVFLMGLSGYGAFQVENQINAIELQVNAAVIDAEVYEEVDMALRRVRDQLPQMTAKGVEEMFRKFEIDEELRKPISELMSQVMEEQKRTSLMPILAEHQDFKTLVEKEEAIKIQSKIGQARKSGLRDAKIAYSTIFVLGLAIAFLGFVFWYRKVQRHLDRILRDDSESSRVSAR